MNAKAFGEHAALGSTIPDIPLDIPTMNAEQASQSYIPILLVYSKFLEAVSRSLVFQLAKTGKWLPLGSCSFLGPIFSTELESQTGDFGIHEAVPDLTLFQLHIKLLPSGSLIAAGAPTIMSHICTIYNAIETGSGRIEVPTGTDVLLTPSGDIYTFNGEEVTQASIKIPKPPAQHRGQSPNMVSGEIRGVDKRPSIVNRLAQRGINVPQRDKWISLQAKRPLGEFGHGIGDPHLSKPESEATIWPASLCFIRSKKSAVEDTDITFLSKLSGGMLLDPLTHAEAWFKAKHARDESMKAVLEQKKKDGELEARLAEEARSRDLQDTHSDSDTGVNQYLSTQDASRIYPTPPDGLRAEPVGPLVDHEHQAISGDLDGNHRLECGDDGLIHSESQFPASPGFVVSSTRYDQVTDDDLFGEMETGIFATSGLTEADFSFFDEPSEDDGNEKGTASQVGNNKPINEIDAEPASLAAASGYLAITEAATGKLIDERKQDKDSFAASSVSDHDQQGISRLPPSLPLA